MSEQELALFPLNTVLFPEGPLPLRIFETRYLDMVSDCMRNEKAFGVCLIRDGAEAGQAAETVEVGTLARIVDWNQLEDGLLGICAHGGERFRLLNRSVRPDKLVVGMITTLAPEPACALPNEYQSLADLLGEFMGQVQAQYTALPERYDDASWVGYRLAELLPIPLARKQYFLELEDPLQRLSQLNEILVSFAES